MKRQKGFTIVELMIVLAVAGLILTIIFFAIPTLQKNGRNNQRKQDVAAVLDTVSQYRLANSGTIPSTNSNPDTFKPQIEKVKLTYYLVSNISLTTRTPEDPIVHNDTDTDTVKLYNRYKCNPNDIGQPTRAGAGFSDIVALFSIESSNGTPKQQCQEL